MMFTLRNDFHHTEAKLIAKAGIVKRAAMGRALRKLCGMQGCTCCGVHGPQEVEIVAYDQNRFTGLTETYMVVKRNA